MKRTDLAKVVVALIAVVIWAYGVRIDQPRLEWLGIAVLVVAFLMRFLSRTKPPSE